MTISYTLLLGRLSALLKEAEEQIYLITRHDVTNEDKLLYRYYTGRRNLAKMLIRDLKRGKFDD